MLKTKSCFLAVKVHVKEDTQTGEGYKTNKIMQQLQIMMYWFLPSGYSGPCREDWALKVKRVGTKLCGNIVELDLSIFSLPAFKITILPAYQLTNLSAYQLTCLPAFPKPACSLSLSFIAISFLLLTSQNCLALHFYLHLLLDGKQLWV